MKPSFAKIQIHGARGHNLKNISLEIPHHQLIVITGVSGSGKSSLAMDTIAAEGRRQFLESIPSFARKFGGKMNKPEVSHISGLFPVISLSQLRSGGSSNSTVGTLSEIYDYLRLLYARFGKSKTVPHLTRSLFSFNSPAGCCPVCRGLGVEEQISLDKLITDPDLSLRQGCLKPTLPNGYIMYTQVTIDVLDTVCREHDFSVDIPWNKLSQEQQDVILNGSTRLKVLYGKHSLESRLKWTALKAKPREEGYYKGILPIMTDILRRDRNKNILRFAESVTCRQCEGTRLNTAALSVRWQSHSIADLADMELETLTEFLLNLSGLQSGETRIVSKIISSLEMLDKLGLSYLQLSRKTRSLTGGEIQGIRLINQAAAKLANVLYIFDEPSLGLHPVYTSALINIMRQLINNGSTVILIEHDPDIIKHADWIIKMGPAAGVHGGQLIFNGSFDKFMDFEREDSLVPSTPVSTEVSETPITDGNNEDLLIPDCNINNLKNFEVKFKTNAINVVTGVSGAGKSSLIYGCLLPRLKNVIEVNQTPIGRTPRSNPATYTGMADSIRDIFAAQPAALAKGFKKSHFSFNNKGGRCETCEGAGKIQIGMHYMGTIDLNCEACNGQRFNREILEIKVNNLSIARVYDLSINEALIFFQDHKKLYTILSLLQSLDLGYLKLGQPSTTLSGGEAQRLKLAAALAKKLRKKTWFILAEPTTGLHYQDTLLLLKALRSLIARGHTVVCLEHQKQIIKAADWIIDLGPGSGFRGGQLIFEGTFPDFLNCRTSITATSFTKSVIPDPVRPRQEQPLKIIRATTNNLKDLTLTFPKNKLTVITGLSGSGKSSLAFATLFAMAKARFCESLSTYARGHIKQSNLAKVESIENLTPAVAVDHRALPSTPRSTVGTLTGIHEKYRYLFSRAAGLDGIKKSASSFSFNHQTGACPACSGLGFLRKADPEKMAADHSLSILNGALTHNSVIRYYGHPDSQFTAILKKAANENNIDLNKPLNRLNTVEQNIIFHGTGPHIYQTTWEYKTRTCSGHKEITGTWKGYCNLIEDEYNRRLHNKNLTVINNLMHDVECKTCGGSRLNKEALLIEIDGLNIDTLAALSLTDTATWFKNGKNCPKALRILKERIFLEITPMLNCLEQLGLQHLSINRRSSTLSHGEAQRLQLARQLNNSLTGLTIILDEPTLGLHSSNIADLLQIIRQLRNKGNTIIVIEHDLDVIEAADYIIEIGPGSGENGGQLVAEGNYSKFIESANSITAPFLKKHLSLQPVTRKLKPRAFGLRGVNKYNLVEQDFDFNYGGLIALTGISGAGKSTLVHQVLQKTLLARKPINCRSYYDHINFDQIIALDQKKLSGNKTGSLCSASGLLPLLQNLFAASDGAKRAGLTKASFSFFTKKGWCPDCRGTGIKKISLDFMEDIINPCEPCNGKRYNHQISDFKLQGCSIADVLQMTLQQTYQYIVQLNNNHPKQLETILHNLLDLGLGHLLTGQNISPLSGGEAQRLKLVIHLLQSKSQKILYLLDEPTSGLHYHDIDNLVRVFNRLADQGHTVLFIEHNKYLISAANQVIQL